MDVESYFNVNMTSTREQFLIACDTIGLRVTSYAGYGSGTDADKEFIYADVALIGSPDAKSLVILTTSAGELSGYFTSDILTKFLHKKLYAKLPPNVSCLLVHAINPKGPIWPSFNVINDNNTPLPDASDWQNYLIMDAARDYNNKKIHINNDYLNHDDICKLPLSKLALPAWNIDVINDIEKRFLLKCQRITLINFEATNQSAANNENMNDDNIDVFYAERAIAYPHAKLSDYFPKKINKIAFTEIQSAVLIDQAGKYANAVLLRAELNQKTNPIENWLNIASYIQATFKYISI